MLARYLVRQVPEWLPATLFDANLSTLEPPNGGSFFAYWVPLARFLLVRDCAGRMRAFEVIKRSHFGTIDLTVFLTVAWQNLHLE